MAEILQTFTIVRRLLAADVVPWPYILSPSNQEKLRLRYRLNQLTQQSEAESGIIARIFSPIGEFVLDGTAFMIEQLSIEPLSLQFQISGDSDLAKKFSDDLGRLFSEINPKRKQSEADEITTTYQTIAVANLAFPHSALFSKQFCRYLDKVLTPEIKPQGGDLEIKLQTLRWLVTYAPPTAEFMLLPKVLIIEPRQNSNSDDRCYFTQSPSDSRTHRKLLESLENTLTESLKE